MNGQKITTLADVYSRCKLASNGCLEWQGYRLPKGYGQAKYKGRNWVVSRLVWLLSTGSISEDIQVLHRCDNPPCSLFGHLFLGTALDNVKDKMAKGRHRCPRGENHPCAILTEADVREMRRLRPILRLRDLAEMFGVTIAAAYDATALNRSWRHLDG